MDTIYERCAGADVHSREVRVCIRVLEDGQLRQQVRSFGTSTRELLALADWLLAERISVLAMESTGVYWKPLWNILENVLEVMLVNAHHVKALPGRKSDTQDCQWIAQLLQHGLLRASFVPDLPQRELRDLTRTRAQMVAQRTQVANRIQKHLEDANIKLAETISDVLGVSGRAMLRAMIAGQSDPAVLAELSRGRMRSKREQLKLALEGRLSEHHRFLLGLLLEEVEALERLLNALEQRIEQAVAPLQKQVELLSSIVGIDRTVAHVILAEVGTDMGRWPDEDHLASWSGLCPGNHQSAGKRKTGRTRQANRWLKAALCQAAWAATHVRESYLSAQYRRIARRRGKKRALLAVAHTLLRIVYQVQKDGVQYQDLGAGWFDHLAPQRLQRHLVRRLESLGYHVTLQPVTPAA
jgi:transposase